MKTVVIVAHKFLPQPDDEFREHLNRQKYHQVVHIYHSFSDAPDRRSYLKWFKNGQIYQSRQTIDFSWLPEPLLYFKELVVTLWWCFQLKTPINDYIAMDGLCLNFGLILKCLTKVDQTIYWAIDFVPKNRFTQAWKNKIYSSLNKYAYLKADQVWDLSPRMKEARQQYLAIAPNQYRQWYLAPYGMWLDRIKTYSYKETEKYTLVFMGHMLEKQGVQHIIKAIPEIIKKVPKFKLKIIGDGSYRLALEKLARQLKVSKYCIFLGKIADSQQMEDEIARSIVAIAPYDKSLDTWTYYADPGKVKTYLACGVPVLLTDIPWNTQEIVSANAGQIITLDETLAASIINAVSRNNDYNRVKARQYANSYDYPKLFKKLESYL